jgi:predicted GNAT family acetyltransferase
METQVVNDAVAQRYRLMASGEEVGFIEYDPIGEDGVLLKHTEVDRKHEGKGYGSKLVAGMLDDLRKRKLSVMPVCPYAIGFLRKHPEYLDVVREYYRSAIK